ncbi:hypothetical protein K8R42_01000 [bacterium]|nr:hypothetical protein [bacterium]
MNLNKLLDLSYLLQRYPQDSFSWPMRITLLIIFIGAILISIYSHKKIKGSPGVLKIVWQKLQAWGWTSGLIGLLLMSFRETQALYLSARLWLLLFLFIVFIWLIFIIIYWKRKIPGREQRIKEEAEFNKWLPKRK